MDFKSHTPEEILKFVKENPEVKIYAIDSGASGNDDVLVGKDEEDIIFDLSCYHEWGNYGVELNPETGLPLGWSLSEIDLGILSEYLDDEEDV